MEWSIGLFNTTLEQYVSIHGKPESIGKNVMQGQRQYMENTYNKKT